MKCESRKWRKEEKRKKRRIREIKMKMNHSKSFFFFLNLYLHAGWRFLGKITDIFSQGNYKAINEVVKTRNNLDTTGTDS